ncbi:MAG: RNA polymerase sigma factor [Phycisphaerae bacterium]|nr:RNA polymerase sigma factor [Phycisphaerae bacterium]
MNRWTSTFEAQLVLASQAGDAGAFATLVDRWHGRLLRHATRLIGDAHAAADVAQETWIAAIASLSRLDDVDAFGAWLFRILTCKCRDWIRHKQRKRGLWNRLLLRTEAMESPGPLTMLASTENHSVHQAIASLPREQAELVTLYYLEEFSILEIAEILNVPAGTVKSRLHYARLTLRELLKESNDVE